MACCLTFLLLCAGLIGSLHCQSDTTAAIPSLQCSYDISPIKFGLKIDINSSSPGSYALIITEKGPSRTVVNEFLWHSNQTSSHEITFLKPCTEYSLSLKFTDLKCDPVGNSDIVRTNEMKKEDVEDGSCLSLPGHVCYKSKWDISSSMPVSNNVMAEQCSIDPNEFCIKLGNDDICTELMTTFTSGNCPSFSRIRDISIDYFEIEQTPPTGLHAYIEHTPFPPNCAGFTIDYTCHETGPSNKAVKPPDLEPFTEYSCTGQINQNNQPIKQTTVPKFTIDCDLKINHRVLKPTDTSIELGWTPSSDNCTFDYITKFGNLKYECNCGPAKGGKQYSRPIPPNRCSVHGLKPYTDYTCTVQPTYAGRPVGTSSEVKDRTEIGVPEAVTGLLVSHPGHNVIKVTCEGSREFNGPKKNYNARLLYDGDIVQQDNPSKCEFEFKDLSHSTTYTLEVRAFNSRHGSPERTQDVTTYYNDKAVIGFLITLITLIVLGICVISAICVKKWSQKTRNDDLELKSTAIYENVPRS